MHRVNRRTQLLNPHEVRVPVKRGCIWKTNGRLLSKWTSFEEAKYTEVITTWKRALFEKIVVDQRVQKWVESVGTND
jgi:hypothetical protein